MNDKPLFQALILASILMVQSVDAHEAEERDDYLASFTTKFSQGFFNTTTGFIEIPKNIINISHDQNILLGLSWGLVRGTAHGVSRTLVGAAEFLTSPIPSGDYITPPYVWQRFSEDTRYFGIHYPGFWTTYGPLDDGDDD